MEGRNLKRFEAHGAFFHSRTGPDSDGDYHSVGDCPFCGRKRKFYVNESSLYWDCKVCQKNGDYLAFLQYVAERNHEEFLRSPEVQKELAEDRGLKRSTLRKAKVGFHAGTYTVPIVHGDAFIDLQRYRLGGKLQSSLGGRKGVFGSGQIRRGTEIWITEGVWDCLALREMLYKAKDDSVDVVSVPGTGTFLPKWAGFFNNRHVAVLFDADGEEEKYAAQNGMKKIESVLRGVAKELKFLHWSDKYSDGYDVRDFYHDSKSSKSALKRLRRWMEKHPPEVPDGEGKKELQRRKKKKKKKARIETISRKDLIKEYRRWLHITDDEVEVLDVMFGVMYANRLEGDPLWMFIVGPPGCGKTELLMTLSKSDYVYSSTTLTTASLISGAQLKDGADPSLIPQLDGLVWIIKDFTTILSMPESKIYEIFGILRDAFDGRIKKVFGTGVVRDYESKFGILAGVTHHINAFHANTTVGERFLRYNVRHDSQSAGSAALISAAIDNINIEDNMRDTLQEVAMKAVDKEALLIPEMTEFWKEHIIPLSQWLSHMRGAVMRDRYSDEVIYNPAAEIGTRVAKQLTKLAMGIGMFHGQGVIGKEVYRTITRVARDTAPDRVEAICHVMYRSKNPMTATKISHATKIEVATISKVLRDMRLLRIVDRVGAGSNLWKLTGSMRKLIDLAEVYFDENRKGKKVLKKKGRRRKNGD